MAAMNTDGNDRACLFLDGEDPNAVAASLLRLNIGLADKCAELKKRAYETSLACCQLRAEVAELRAQLSRYEQEGTVVPD